MIARKLTYISLMMLVLAFNKASAQADPCIAQLNDAGSLIEDGRYDDGIALLRSTLEKCEFSAEDKIEAYKTLIIAYFETDQLEAAEECARIILRINPKYRTSKLRDRVEMVELFEKFRPISVLRAGLEGGINFSLVEAENVYSMVSSDDVGALDNYGTQVGFQIGIPVEYRVWRSFWAMTGLSYRNSIYTNTLDNVQGRQVNYRESLSYLDLPLIIRYDLLQGDIKPYVKLGARASFLISALGELSRDELSDLINRDAQRNGLQVAMVAGAGVSYEYNSLVFRFDVSYSNFPSYVNKDGTRFQNLETIFRYYYLDNDFTIDLVQLNLSLHYPLVFKNVKTR